MSDELRALLGFIAAGAKKVRPPTQTQGFPYSCFEDYVYDRGKEYKSTPLTDEELREVAKLSKKKFDFVERQCFYNAQRIVLDFNKSGRFRYVEGYVFATVSFPILHGWVSINDKVIDLTLRTKDTQRDGPFSDRIVGTFESNRAYVGVEFPIDVIEDRIHRTGKYGSIIDDWRDTWPELRKPRLHPPPSA